MKKQTSQYYSELAKLRWEQRDNPPDVTDEVSHDLQMFGAKGGKVGGNKFSKARQRAFTKGNSQRWRLFRYLHELRNQRAPSD